MRALRLVLPLVMAVLVAVPVLSQFGPGRGGGGGPGGLIARKEVQKELKLTDDQIKKVDAHTEKNREKMQELFQAGDKEKFKDAMKEIATDTEKFIEKTLNADQQKRLKQIQRQQMGPNAFSDEETAKELKLNDEQKDGIKKITEDLGSQSKEAFTGVDFQDQEAMKDARKKVQGLRKEATEKITKMLTPEQKKTWKELTGEQFDLPPGGFGKGGKGGFGKGGKDKSKE
jgi:Spy/CpxP family protein refolding chaperone